MNNSGKGVIHLLTFISWRFFSSFLQSKQQSFMCFPYQNQLSRQDLKSFTLKYKYLINSYISQGNFHFNKDRILELQKQIFHLLSWVIFSPHILISLKLGNLSYSQELLSLNWEAVKISKLNHLLIMSSLNCIIFFVGISHSEFNYYVTIPFKRSCYDLTLKQVFKGMETVQVCIILKF